MTEPLLTNRRTGLGQWTGSRDFPSLFTLWRLSNSGLVIWGEKASWPVNAKGDAKVSHPGERKGVYWDCLSLLRSTEGLILHKHMAGASLFKPRHHVKHGAKCTSDSLWGKPQPGPSERDRRPRRRVLAVPASADVGYSRFNGETRTSVGPMGNGSAAKECGDVNGSHVSVCECVRSLCRPQKCEITHTLPSWCSHPAVPASSSSALFSLFPLLKYHTSFTGAAKFTNPTNVMPVITAPFKLLIFPSPSDQNTQKDFKMRNTE